MLLKRFVSIISARFLRNDIQNVQREYRDTYTIVPPNYFISNFTANLRLELDGLTGLYRFFPLDEQTEEVLREPLGVWEYLYGRITLESLYPHSFLTYILQLNTQLVNLLYLLDCPQLPLIRWQRDEDWTTLKLELVIPGFFCIPYQGELSELPRQSYPDRNGRILVGYPLVIEIPNVLPITLQRDTFYALLINQINHRVMEIFTENPNAHIAPQYLPWYQNQYNFIPEIARSFDRLVDPNARFLDPNATRPMPIQRVADVLRSLQSIPFPPILPRYQRQEGTDRGNPKSKPKLDIKTDCSYYSGVPYLKCAVNPASPCSDCPHYAPKDL